MGIPIEFSPDLALRDMKEYKAGRRKEEECLPEKLEVGKIHNFLKKDQRSYWFYGGVPLIETKGNWELSPPIASVQILEATHFLENGEVFTRGKYKILEIIDDKNIPYDYFNRLGFAEK